MIMLKGNVIVLTDCDWQGSGNPDFGVRLTAVYPSKWKISILEIAKANEIWYWSGKFAVRNLNNEIDIADLHCFKNRYTDPKHAKMNQDQIHELLFQSRTTKITLKFDNPLSKIDLIMSKMGYDIENQST